MKKAFHRGWAMKNFGRYAVPVAVLFAVIACSNPLLEDQFYDEDPVDLEFQSEEEYPYDQLTLDIEGKRFKWVDSGLFPPSRFSFRAIWPFLGWQFYPVAKSEDGKIVVGYAENELGFSRGAYHIDAGTKVGVYWKIGEIRTRQRVETWVSTPKVIGLIPEKTPDQSYEEYSRLYWTLRGWLAFFNLDKFEAYMTDASAIEVVSKRVYEITGLDQDGLPAIATMEKWLVTSIVPDGEPPVAIGIPENPNPPEGATITDTTPLLEWDDVDPAIGYEVEISETDTFSTILEEDATLSASQYQMTAVLSNSGTYYWRARAKNGDGDWGDWSAAWSFSVAIGVPTSPDPPDGGTTNDNTPLLDWADVVGAGNYDLRYGTDAGTLPTETPIPTTVSEYQVTTPVSGEVVYWQARAFSEDAVAGDWSAVWSFTIAYAIGDTGPAGGIIFYDDESDGVDDLPGDRYLEAAPSDQGSGVEWGGYGTEIGTDTIVGAGEANTNAIAAALGSGTYAAFICYDLSLGGYDDWFLPSKDELDLMFNNLKLAVPPLGGLGEGLYWSSSEDYDTIPADKAWVQLFGSAPPNQGGFDKFNGAEVRAVRAF